MAKTLTFKSLIAVLMIAFGFQYAYSQTAFWSDDFNSSSNWVYGGTNPGPEVWTWTDDPAAGFQTPNNAVPPFGSATADNGYWLFNSDANGDGNTHDVTLTGSGNSANCTGKSGVHVRFYTQYAYANAGSVAEVGISVGGGAFNYYTLVPDLPPNTIAEGVADIAIPEADGQSNVVVQFRWLGTWEYHWKVDDVELYEAVSQVHDVTFKVNAALLTVDPAGMFITGSFNNGADQVMTNEGSGIWSYTTQVEEGATVEYKFENGPNGPEQGQAACGVSDGAGGYNRTVTVGTDDITLPAVCFNSCDPCVVPCALNPNKIVCDNFEQYNTTQKLAAQNVAQNGAANAWWTTWDGVTGTTEDGIMTTEQANSGTKSVKVVSTAATGGPQDVVLKLGNKTTGRYELKWMCYIPTDKQGYYNIQNVVPISGGAWNLDVFFEAAGSGHIQIGAGASLATFAYPNAQWFEVRHIIDLDNNLLTLYVNGKLVTKMAYANNLGGIDFYGTNNFNQYYIDDVEYVSLPPLVYNVDVCDAAVDLSLYFGQTTTQTTGIYDNTNATTSSSDPAVDCWNETTGADILNTTMWYTFAGDGKKYHIETVPCNATNYIGTVQQDPGDTQMLVYAGDNCSDLTEVACNDDVYADGNPDWRSGVDLETVPGQNYYMMIDGFEFSGTLATGQFCIEISQVPSILCADGAAGTYQVSSPYLCEQGQLADLLSIDAQSFVIPNEGPVFGMAWAITSAPIPANTWPRDVSGLLVGSTQFLATPFVVSYVNDGDPFPPNIYYVTPVILGGGVDIDSTAAGSSLFDTDPGDGCFFLGESQLVVFLPLTDDITATATTGSGSVNVTPGGGIFGITGDDSAFSYLWSNGATTQDLSGVASGTYTVTVSDACSNPFVLTVQVTVGTTDPASIHSFVVSPNPTSGIVNLSVSLADVADVRIEVLNTLGQTLQTINAGKLSNVNQNIDLSKMTQGSYFLRVTVDGETAIRRVVLQR